VADDPIMPIPDASSLPLTSNAAPPSPEQIALARIQAGQQPPRQSQQPPVPQPILQTLIQGLARPPQTQPDQMGVSRPVSRLDTFESFLGNFVTALGQGLSAAHGPGAFGKGFGAAVTAPYQQAVGQFEQGQSAQANQAEIQQKQAQTALTQRQTELTGQMATISIPGMGPMTVPINQLGNIMKGAAGAGIAAQSRMSVEQLKLFATAGQISTVKPAVDEQGKPTYAAYDKQGNFLKFLDKSVDPAMLAKTSTTGQWLPDGNGGFILASKSTTTAPVMPTQPGAGAAGSPQAQLAAKVPALAGRTGGAAQPRQRIYTDQSGIALNPQTGELLQTTAAEAAQKGYSNFSKATEPEMAKYRSSQAQFNDVQTNTSRYTAAATRAVREQPTFEDYANMHSIMNQKGLYDFNIAVAQGGHFDLPLLGGFTEGASRAEKSGAYRSLSPQAKDLIDGYFRTVASVPAYMKALTGIGRFNKEQMDLEIQNIPNPTMGPQDIQRKLGQWQENIDQGVSSVPRMQGIPTTKDIRARYEVDTSAKPNNNSAVNFGRPKQPSSPAKAVVQKMLESLGGNSQ